MLTSSRSLAGLAHPARTSGAHAVVRRSQPHDADRLCSHWAAAPPRSGRSHPTRWQPTSPSRRSVAGLRRRRGGPERHVLGWDVLRVHHGNRPGNYIQALTELRQSRFGVAALYRWVRIERTAQPAVLGDVEYPDLARRLLLRRALGHVLRRLAEPPSERLGIQLHLGGDGGDAEPTVFSDTSPGARVRRARCRGARPEPVRRSRHRHRLPAVEVQRRWGVGGAIADLVGAAERRAEPASSAPHRAAHRRPAAAAMGDDDGRPADGLRHGTYDLLFSGGDFTDLELQRGPGHLLRAARTLQPADGAVLHHLRHRLRARRWRALPRRGGELVARLRRLVDPVHLVQLRRGAGAVHGADRSEQRPVVPCNPPSGARRLPLRRQRRGDLHLRQPTLLRFDRRHPYQPARRGYRQYRRRRRLLDGRPGRRHLLFR